MTRNPERPARSRKLAAALMASALALTPALTTPAQAFLFGGGGRIVYDPRNHAENILSSARALEQINNQIAQIQNQVFPVTGLVEPGEGDREGGILPTPRQPGCVVQHAQSAQGLDQQHLPELEVAELAVTLEDIPQLARHLVAVPGQQHPQVLYCGSGLAVVQVDEMRTFFGPQDVAVMTVPVQPDDAGRHGVERAFDPSQEAGGDRRIAICQLGR